MLETRNLTKVYKPKKGVPVKALDNVSIRFPEKGMVFLLGKSGSGKSTLLNLLGGLDRYNGGEIIIKGVSSKAFRQKHFDSYRNTYVGFIFQEYNILDEFSVGTNIALAIQLQGRKAADEDINAILEQVDLAGYGNRKPNELSGGQKQRVAIARALVKNPRIIMADEPTGALDSATGRQVLDTLKKLSSDKLVIVVSHDREFAERYADRVIELADGRVISDVEYAGEADSTEEVSSLSFSGSTVTLPEKYHLTEEDRLQINAYIDSLEKGEVTLSLSGNRAAGSRRAVATDESRIPVQKSGDFKLIKSRLPMRYAFKMGASSLKYKKVRLVFTVLLSCVAFGLFGLADTFGAYDYVTTCTNSLMDSGVTYASLVKSVKEYYGEGENDFYYTTRGHYLSDGDLQKIYEDTGLRLSGVYSTDPTGGKVYFEDYLGELPKTDGMSDSGEDNLYSSYINGYAEITPSTVRDSGFELVCGQLPDGNENEIAVSLYLAQSFIRRGYVDRDAVNAAESGNGEYGESLYDAVKISSPNDLIGKTLFGHTIVGVIDTKVDMDRYKDIFTYSESDTTADTLVKYALQQEFRTLCDYSLCCVAMVGDGFVDKLASEQIHVSMVDDWMSLISDSFGSSFYIEALADAADISADDITWVNGEVTELSDKDIILPYSMAADLLWGSSDIPPIGDGTNGTVTEQQAIINMLASDSFSLSYDRFDGNAYQTATEAGCKVVGIYNDGGDRFRNTLFASPGLYDRHAQPDDGIYTFAVAAMPEESAEISKLVAYGDTNEADVRFELQNPVTYELSALRDIFEKLSPIFLYIGLGFALFASLMLSNFISTSITYKKREIGILRAIGSRGNDVFRIFFSESFIIAMINFLLTTVGLFVVTGLINTILRDETGLLITVLHCGPRQVMLEFAVSILVAAAASFIPVKRIASKKPIDAIRDR